ncbi:MAG: hypothetical protein ABL930_05785 [Pseudobdellovibrio sp.]
MITALFFIITAIAIAIFAYGLVYKLGAKVSALVPHKLIKGTRGPEGLVALFALIGSDKEINEAISKLNLSKEINLYRFYFLIVSVLFFSTFILILKVINT